MDPAAHPHVSTASLQSGARIALLGMVINAALAMAKIVAGVLGTLTC